MYADMRAAFANAQRALRNAVADAHKYELAAEEALRWAIDDMCCGPHSLRAGAAGHRGPAELQGGDAGFPQGVEARALRARTGYRSAAAEGTVDHQPTNHTYVCAPATHRAPQALR